MVFRKVFASCRFCQWQRESARDFHLVSYEGLLQFVSHSQQQQASFLKNTWDFKNICFLKFSYNFPKFYVILEIL
jgi:hypothetical protein